MLTQYHIEIMLASLGKRFSPRAMSVIIYANINQDRLAGQIGHDEFHFDNNAFDKSYAYIEEQRARGCFLAGGRRPFCLAGIWEISAHCPGFLRP
jgi:hypothetical protein